MSFRSQKAITHTSIFHQSFSPKNHFPTNVLHIHQRRDERPLVFCKATTFFDNNGFWAKKKRVVYIHPCLLCRPMSVLSSSIIRAMAQMSPGIKVWNNARTFFSGCKQGLLLVFLDVFRMKEERFCMEVCLRKNCGRRQISGVSSFLRDTESWHGLIANVSSEWILLAPATSV